MKYELRRGFPPGYTTQRLLKQVAKEAQREIGRTPQENTRKRLELALLYRLLHAQITKNKFDPNYRHPIWKGWH